MSDLRGGLGAPLMPLLGQAGGLVGTVASSSGGPRMSAGAAANITSSSVFERIEHTSKLSADLASLCMSEELSDVTFTVEGENLPAHRVILASRSEYFRAMLFGGMREQTERVIPLLETPLDIFKELLRYIYTGTLCLSEMREEQIIEILGLAHKYTFPLLLDAIADYLKASLDTHNVCTVFNVAQLYSLRSLSEACFLFADRNAEDILASSNFLLLSASSVDEIISRDSFCASEINIFRAIVSWAAAHPEERDRSLKTILSRVRLSLIPFRDLFDVVRPSGLFKSDTLLDAIKEQAETRCSSLTHRGFLCPDVNVVTAQTASVIEGESPAALLLPPDSSIVQDGDRLFTRHLISDSPLTESDGIVVMLKCHPYIINCIILHLWDREARSYSYYVEVSMDRKDWARIIDHSKYSCRSRQTLLFPARAVRYIRVVGTMNSVNKFFTLTHMEAFYTSEPFEVDPDSGLMIPSQNMATITRSALVLEGVSRSRNALINGETTNYDWDNGYTCHQLGSGMIVVQLPQPFLVSNMRLLLWDCDDRFYSYYIEVSCNQQSWKRVVDKTAEECRAWQFVEFPPEPVVFIRIVGTRNSANEVFHCVHLECPANSPLPEPAEREQPLPEGQQFPDTNEFSD